MGTLELRGFDGFTQVVPSAITVAGYVASFVLLAIELKSLPGGIVYAIWSAIGIALVALLGKLRFDDPAPSLAIVGMVLIVVGVVSSALQG